MKRGTLTRILDRLQGESLRAHLVRGASGSIAIAGIQRLLTLGSAVILARVLAPSGYGIYVFAISLMGLLQIPAQFGMNQLLAREVAASEATGRWDLVRGLLQRSVQFVGVSSTVIALVTLAVLWLAPLHVSQEWRLTLSLSVALMVLNAYGALSASSLMGLRRVIVAQLPLSLGRPALLLAGVAALWLGAFGHLDAITAMGVNVTATALMVGVSFGLSIKSFRVRATNVAPTFETRRWLSSALPFTLMAGMWVVSSQTDVVMLGTLAHAGDVGIYRIAALGAGLIPMLLGAVNGALGPSLARLYAVGDRGRLARVVRFAALAGLAGGLVSLAFFALWGHAAIRIVFGQAYVSAWLPLMVLGAGQLTNAGVGPVGLVLNMTGHERDSFFGMATAAFVNIALNAMLIPAMGTTGAAAATAISTAVWNVLLTWRVRQRLGFLPFGFGRISTSS